MTIGYAICRKGKVEFITFSPNFAAVDRLPPVAEVPLERFGMTYPDVPNLESWIERLSVAYANFGQPGRWGDLIQFELGDAPAHPMRILLVAPLAFRKPALAADLALFIRDNDGRIFFVGITRGAPPGLGEFALIGGFRDFEDGSDGLFRLEQPNETLGPGSPEETGINVKIYGKRMDDPYASPLCGSVWIPPVLEDKRVLFHYVGSLYPREKEILDPHLKRRHVDQTAAYAAVVQADRSLTAEMITAALEPTDEDEKTHPVAYEIMRDEESIQALEGRFYFPHHQKFFRAAYELLEGALYPPPEEGH